MKLVSSGTVSKDTEGALAFSHQVIRSYDRDDDTLKQVIHYPDEAEQDYSRSDLMVYNQLKTGAETQGLYSTSAYNCARISIGICKMHMCGMRKNKIGVPV